MDVVDFSRVEVGSTVAEVGAGTGNFLSLFSEVASNLIAIDLTPGMLQRARAEFPNMHLVLADGVRLPFGSRSIDVVTCAQMLHHVFEPLPLLKEMRRVAKRSLVIVDQIAPESYEQTAFMNQLEAIRDPSHAASRSASTMRVLVQSAGLEIVDERLASHQQTMSGWMAPGEFPPERFRRVEDFIEKFGAEAGLNFRKERDEWAWDRRRVMFLCSR